MNTFEICITDKTLRELKSTLIVSHISGRGLSLSERFMEKLITLIKQGETKYTFEIKDKNNG